MSMNAASSIIVGINSSKKIESETVSQLKSQLIRPETNGGRSDKLTDNSSLRPFTRDA
jgi:hypothetical protein